MDDLATVAPSLPLWLMIPVTLVLLATTLWAMLQLRNAAANFVIAAAWTRYIVGTYHEFTFNRSPLGPSYAALIGLVVCIAGLFIVRPRLYAFKALIPIYILVGIAVISAFANGAYIGLLGAATKFGYLIAISLCMYEALCRFGDRYIPYLLVAFMPPYIFQWFSVLFNIPKAGESDGSLSYIGGYGHEGAYSVVIGSAIVAVCLTRKISTPLRATVITAGIVGLMLAGYRTTILAFLPFLLVVFVTGPLTRLRPAYRVVTVIGALAAGLLLTTHVGSSTETRYRDMGSLEQVTSLVSRNPAEFTRAERQLLSARPYIWARYVTAWRNGPPHAFLIGLGPEERANFEMPGTIVKDRYAHNTLVSALYEYGIAGVLAYLLVFATPFLIAMKTRGVERIRLLAAHFTMILINMSTMPMWQFEGIVLYGFMLGMTLYARRREEVAQTLSKEKKQVQIAFPETRSRQDTSTGETGPKIWMPGASLS